MHAPNAASRANDVVDTLRQIWKAILDLEEVGCTDDFFRLGGDSIAAAQLVMEIEKHFGRRLAMESLLKESSIARQADLLRSGESHLSVSSLVALQSEGARPPFFCVHPVGGEVLCYADLARHFPKDQPFYGIRSAEPNGLAQLPLSIPELAKRYVEQVRAVCPSGPYQLGGYSFGGSVALEMAQQLLAAGQEVALLAILDHTPPPIRYRSALARPSFPVEFLVNAPRWIQDDLFGDGLHKVSHRARIRAGAAFGKLGGLVARRAPVDTPPEVGEFFDLTRMPDLFRRQLENHYRILRTYEPQSYRGRVVLFRARTRPLLRLHGKDLGWQKLAKAGLEVIVVPGNHESMLKEPHVGHLAARLTDCLRQARVSERAIGESAPAGSMCPIDSTQ
jgi:thioesterase domain-containing protein/acyl carrier protein